MKINEAGLLDNKHPRLPDYSLFLFVRVVRYEGSYKADNWGYTFDNAILKQLIKNILSPTVFSNFCFHIIG